MMIIETGQFDPTPEEQHERDLAEWRSMLAAFEVEHKVVAQRVDQLERRLVGLDQSSASAAGHAQAMLQIERVTIADRLDHAKARLPAIAAAIAAHRKAKP